MDNPQLQFALRYSYSAATGTCGFVLAALRSKSAQSILASFHPPKSLTTNIKHSKKCQKANVKDISFRFKPSAASALTVRMWAAAYLTWLERCVGGKLCFWPFMKMGILLHIPKEYSFFSSSFHIDLTLGAWFVEHAHLCKSECPPARTHTHTKVCHYLRSFLKIFCALSK